MPDYRITEQAQLDLEEIDAYVAEDNPAAADQLLDDLYAAMRRVADDPDGSGIARSDLTDRNVRFSLVRKSYWLVYVADRDDVVTIVRVLHARRDIPNVL